MKQYTIVIEQTPNNYSAYVPDLPGCVTTGATVEETVENMKEAIGLHIETMEELGLPIPDRTPATDALPDHAVIRHVEIAA